ncbi:MULTISPECIES: hypothetical protein [Bizionia]|uniref:Uncharacterized protein n=1 Tax=Bizionia algoritergicola TaxID=291187 RepID=A0A5D0QZ97_9FLAO|nr:MULTISPECIES: hypothetical protein [Bizionia]OBX17810.1 hypothetical protein BAA08_15760 [Bizionia sp. APA-3]TYB74570.1 hypothetical protein ES675_00045 [Bizionia algoritergicola]
MKKLLFVLLLLFAFSINAQDISRFRSMSYDEALGFSQTIANEIRQDWRLYKEDSEGKLIEFWYIPKDADEAILKKVKELGVTTSGIDFFIVNYEVFQEGEDLDMEIEGVKRYRFYDMTLKFLDAFPIWEKYFLNGATIENTRNNKDLDRKLETDEYIWMYKFRPAKSPYWSIHKIY